jgi:hypothetical protein
MPEGRYPQQSCNRERQAPCSYGRNRIFAEGIELEDYLSPDSLYRRAVFPLREPLDVVAGDKIRCRIEAFLHGEEYTWRWRTEITDGETGRPKAEFDQTSIAGIPLAAETLEQPSSLAP